MGSAKSEMVFEPDCTSQHLPQPTSMDASSLLPPSGEGGDLCATSCATDSLYLDTGVDEQLLRDCSCAMALVNFIWGIKNNFIR